MEFTEPESDNIQWARVRDCIIDVTDEYLTILEHEREVNSQTSLNSITISDDCPQNKATTLREDLRTELSSVNRLISSVLLDDNMIAVDKIKNKMSKIARLSSDYAKVNPEYRQLHHKTVLKMCRDISD